MKEVNILHKQAMACADQAEEAKRNGRVDEYIAFTQKAFQYEAEAARRVANEISFEPTRSVLFRSAAALALECKQLREAERLIAAALAGQPPTEIAEELRDLLEDVYFQRHLEVRGVTLSPDEFQMSLEGAAVGFGIARSDAFIQRVKSLETLLYRTAERQLNREFREAGRRKKSMTEDLELYISVPRAASFAVTVRLGKSTQLGLPGIDFAADTLNVLLDGIAMVGEGRLNEIQEAIPDEAYRNNFLGLVEQLAPDGNDIKSVGFTAGSDKGGRMVALATPKKELRERIRKSISVHEHVEESLPLEIQGVLLEADAKGQQQGIIEVVDSNGVSHKIIVPRGLMRDIVKPMFEEEVIVVGSPIGGKINLLTISPVVPEGEGE
jgi:hypothetical protein